MKGLKIQKLLFFVVLGVATLSWWLHNLAIIIAYRLSPEP